MYIVYMYILLYYLVSTVWTADDNLSVDICTVDDSPIRFWKGGGRAGKITTPPDAHIII